MSKKSSRKQKKNTLKAQKKQAKENRQRNNPGKWEEKKDKKRSSQQKRWDSQYPYANSDCPLSLSVFPSPKTCKGCTLHCIYSP